MNRTYLLHPSKFFLGLAQVMLTFVLCLNTLSYASDSLPSWRESPTKQTILDFVARVTDKKHPHYVHPNERIAVFDNDGTLWAEQPMYFQLLFAMDRIKALAPQHPEWKDQQPFKAVLNNDRAALAASGMKGLLQLLMASHAGMTTEEFEHLVKEWLATAKHPRFKRPYTEIIYQPMLELLDYLRAHGFKTFIVSGGGIEFMRPWVEHTYGIPPEQVVGSSIKTKFEMRDGTPVIIRLPELDFLDDKAGKPVAIHKYIGRRPIAAFGNSDGDLQMLQWTAARKGASLMLLVHHTDSDREWAYDRKSKIGHLGKALEEAQANRWTIVDMKKDWKIIFSFSREDK